MKRGQFYIVTTIMIVAIIVGFASLSNFSQKRSALKFFYEGEELELEAGKIIDYGISTDSSSAGMILTMDTFAKDYMTYSSADNFYFIFGVFVFVSLGGGICDLNEFLRFKPPPT